MLFHIIFTLLNYYSVEHCENIWNNYIVSILKGIYNYKQATFHFDDQITTDKKEKKVKRAATGTAVQNC